MNRIVSSVLVAALVVLAGCTGGIGGPSDAQASDGSTVAFYVSDERNAIDRFSHLNVTVTEVGFQTSADAEANASANASASGDSGNESVEGDAESEADAEAAADAEAEGWVTRDVEDRTVDLTELQGANATLLGNVSVPAGEYGKVFVHVSEVNGTLKSGETVNVKLPSEKLHVEKGFRSDGSADVEFVFDITVFEAGKSGKFILKPVASESGTDVDIEVVGGSGVGADSEAHAEAELDMSVVGNATAGENATVKVTSDGEAVANATLRADGEVVATTSENGTATVRVPEDGELELEASASGTGGGDGADANAEGELELELGESGDDSDDGDGSANGSASADLAATLDGSFAAGEQATVTVTDGDGDPVADAGVAVDGEVVGETNADGELAFEVPADATVDSDVTVTANGSSVTLDAQTVAAAN